MLCDLEKLDRIEAQALVASDALKSTFDLYRGRLQSASRKRSDAFPTAPASWRFDGLSWSELAAVPEPELKQFDVHIGLLAEAFRDLKAAHELYAEYERRMPAVRQQLELVRRLCKFVGREQ